MRARAHERYDDALFACTRNRRGAFDRRRGGAARRAPPPVLDNLQRVVEALERARGALSGDESGAIGALGAAAASLRGIADVAPSFLAMSEHAAALQSEAGELAAIRRGRRGERSRPGRTRCDQRAPRTHRRSETQIRRQRSKPRSRTPRPRRAAAAEYEGRDRRIADARGEAKRSTARTRSGRRDSSRRRESAPRRRSASASLPSSAISRSDRDVSTSRSNRSSASVPTAPNASSFSFPQTPASRSDRWRASPPAANSRACCSR